jgi:hypothetical protein
MNDAKKKKKMAAIAAELWSAHGMKLMTSCDLMAQIIPASVLSVVEQMSQNVRGLFHEWTYLLSYEIRRTFATQFRSNLLKTSQVNLQCRG